MSLVKWSNYLVCNIKECHMVLLFDKVSNLLPLLWCWVDTGGVVCTPVQQYD